MITASTSAVRYDPYDVDINRDPYPLAPLRDEDVHGLDHLVELALRTGTERGGVSGRLGEDY